MKQFFQIATAAALVVALASPALAAKATMTKEQRAEMKMKTDTCKKEAAEQHFGVHLMKKRAFMKDCMKKG